MTSGFTFGAKTTAAPTFGTGSFGAPANQPQLGFGAVPATPSLFGQSTSTFKPATGFSLGGTGNPGYAFGAQAAPAAFGATATSAPTLGFGATATNAPTFGASVSSTPSLGFGAPITSTPGLNFGASTNPSFGAPTTTAPTLGFGAHTSGFSFGAPVSTSGLTFGTTPVSTGLAFGSTPASTGLTFGTSTPSTGLSFGASAPSTELGFGTTTISTTPSLGLSFGVPSSAPSTGLGFGTPTPTTGLGFATPTTGLGFGTPTPTTGLGFGTPTPTTGLGFGTPTPTTGLGLGATSTGFGLGGVTATSAPTLTVASQPAVTGLGGIATNQTKVTTQQKEIPPKEQLLPNELFQTVEHFKKHVQEQKVCSSEVARCSIKEFRKLETELDALNQLLNQLETHLLNNRNQVESLKYDTAKGLQHIEMAQRTQDTPPGLQFENTAPIQYFLELAEYFEKDLQLLKTKIDNAEKFIRKYGENPTLTSQDLTTGLKRLHSIFVALAGRMYSIHNQVETQKEQFLNMRRQLFNDSVNPFEKTNRNEAINTILNYAVKTTNILEGPTPFNNMVLGSNNAVVPQQPTTSSLGTATQTASQPLFKDNTNTSHNFQLQKPPSGSKRGKQ